MRVLFVAALSVALLSTPAAAGIKAYCEEMREVLAPVFEVAVYGMKRELAKAKRLEATKKCDDKFNKLSDSPTTALSLEKETKNFIQCLEKAAKKYPKPKKPLQDLKVYGKTLDLRKAHKELKSAALFYSAYCKKF